MKRLLSLLLVSVMLISTFSFLSFSAETSLNSVTSFKTPTSSASIKFSKKFGANYKAPPTPPIVVEDTLILFSGLKLYKLDCQTGKEIASVKAEGSSLYATLSPLYADGKIFVQLDGGIIQAFDFKTMKSLWVYKDSLEGQALCPITYDDGYIYTGFWNGETEYANYVCISTKDSNPNKETESKKAAWTYKALGGFYWAGCAVTKSYVVFGKDDGKKGSESSSKIIALNKKSGKSVSTLSVKGDIRSSVAYSSQTKSYYVSSKAGYVYKFSLNSSNGKLTLQKKYKAPGAVTASPVLYGKRLYIGAQSSKGGKFIVLNSSTMEEIYTCDMKGYPQATMLLSKGYENENGKVYIYSTYNTKPGGITVFEDGENQTSPLKTELFAPEKDMSEYSISTISASEDGTLYYKNDSGYIFALEKKKNLSFFQRLIEAIRNIFKKIFGR